MKLNKKEWFENWFDSPFYHILYKNRSEGEAEIFISNLINFLKPSKTNSILDVACGKGRHSFYLNSLGYNVHGFDLSKNSINFAKKNESEQLKFYVNDIRTPLNINKYDYAFNLFTSFGYFDDEKDNQLAIDSISKSLTKNGVLVLDFMNSNKVLKNINNGVKETKNIDGIDFEIHKYSNDGFIFKDICFSFEEKKYSFQEKVKSISLNAFKTYFLNANLEINSVFGDYDLNPFDKKTSDRLIIVAKKNE